MGDLWNIISSNYVTVGGMTNYSSGKYTNVDPADYEGTWSGAYGDNTKFQITVSQVDGFKAKVKYQSGSTVNYSQVLIKDSAFRIGDNKFVLQGPDQGLVATIVTDPSTGTSSMKQAYATRG
jgi:hypothetical protein